MPANRNKKFEKAKDFKSAIKRLLKELNPFKALVILSLTLSVAASILSIVTPNILSKLTDKISNGIVPNMENLVRINNEISSNFASGNAKDIEIDGVVISTIEQSEYLNVIKDIDKNAKVNELYSKIDEFPDTIKSLIKPSMDLSGITRISVFIGCLYLISAIFNYIESISMTIVSNKFAKKLRSSISSKINKLPLKYFDKNRTGDTLSRVTNDIDTVAQSMDNSLSTLVSASALFIGTLIMMFVTNALMAVTAILSSMIGFAFMFFVLGKSQKYFEAKQRELGNLNSHIEEVYSSLNVVKAYNGKELSDKKFDELNNKLYNANRKSQFLSGLMHPLMNFVGNVGYVAVAILGGYFAVKGRITVGNIQSFIQYNKQFTRANRSSCTNIKYNTINDCSC